MSRTLGQLLAEAAARLAEAGVESPRTDARCLAQAALGLDTARLIGRPELPVDDAAAARLAGLVARRAGREPLSQILGTREFWSLPFTVTPDTLTPRPDSETVVEAALDHARPARPGRPLRVLDLGTGTGCLLLAVLHERPDAVGLGIDASGAAIEVARANAAALGLAGRSRFRRVDWHDAAAWPRRAVDLVLANPPYIPDPDLPGLEPEVAQHEPRLALAGGADGLDAYRALVPRLGRRLAGDGVAALEVGAGQADDVAALGRAAGLFVREVRRDLAARGRCVVLASGPVSGGAKKRLD